MSYAMAAALQSAIFERLTGDPALNALVGDAIADGLPPGPVPPVCVSLGPETARDRSDRSGRAAEHRLTITVLAQTAGFVRAKEVAGRIETVLSGADLTLPGGRLVGLWLDRAQARRSGRAGATRRIDLRFRALVEKT